MLFLALVGCDQTHEAMVADRTFDHMWNAKKIGMCYSPVVFTERLSENDISAATIAAAKEGWVVDASTNPILTVYLPGCTPKER